MTESRRLRVAIVFGGVSTEHDVSLTSALSIFKQIDFEKYDVLAIRISKEGQWQILPNPGFQCKVVYWSF